MHRMRLRLAGLTLVCLMAGGSSVSAQEFFGLDIGGTENTRAPSLTNSTSAQMDFLSYLVGTGTESFETFGTGAFASGTTLNFPGAGNATLTSANAMTIDQAAPGGTNGVGRYPISGSRFLEANAGSFTVAFENPIAAFGFFGTDVGDFGSQLFLTFLRDGGSSSVVEVDHATTFTTGAGSALFYGFIDETNPFNAVQFSLTGTDDFIGIDNMTIGSVQQVIDPTVAPEPVTFILLASGLAGIAAARRRRANGDVVDA